MFRGFYEPHPSYRYILLYVFRANQYRLLIIGSYKQFFCSTWFLILYYEIENKTEISFFLLLEYEGHKYILDYQHYNAQKTA